jgi:DnaJ family protein B protein 12
MVTIIERDIAKSETSGSTAESSGTSTPQTKAKATGVEEHVTSAHQRPGHKTATGGANAEASGSGTKKREYTPKQMEVVKRVKSCQHHEYYKILAGKSTDST